MMRVINSYSLVILITAIGEIGAVASLQLPRCEKIISPICQHIGYNMTLMPNFAGHNTQQDAARGLQAFQPLLHYNCSRHLRLFVCSVFIPFCSEHVPGAVPACRDLCETVRNDCQPVLDQFLLPWPAELECSRFPAPPALCMHHPVTGSEDNDQNFTTLLTHVDPPRGSFSHCPPRFASVDETCTPLCGADAYYRSEDKYFTKTWIVVWSACCSVLTVVTLLTFWVERSRFKYPERPLLFMTLCCFVYSSLVLVRTLVGPNLVVCTGEHLVIKSSENTLCATSSFILHHLELAIRMWWMMFCVCWYLHAACEWSNESLMGMASLFQAVVYGFSGIPALLALATGHTTADELTGSCGIREESSLWFIVVPHSLYLVIGGLFAVGCSNALLRVKASLQAAGRSTEKLERLMARLAVFTALFLITEISYLVCTIYESWHRPWWKSLALLSALDCRSCSHEPVYHTASLQVVLLRIMFNMLVSVCCMMWVCSGKTCRTWIRVLNSPNKSVQKIPITKV